MHISADGRRLHNPSAIPLWFSVKGNVSQIGSGEDVSI